MKIGDFVNTPRFCKVELAAVFPCPCTARERGFVEPTHFQNDQWEIWGKHTGKDMMIFAAILKHAVLV